MEQLFYIGSYSLLGGYFPEAKGDGVTTYSLNLETGKMDKKAACTAAANATYLIRLDVKTLLIAQDKYYDSGNIMLFTIEENGHLKKGSSQDVFGAATCHLAINKKNNKVFVVSYLDSKLSVHSIKDNAIKPTEQVYQYIGKGPNKERQEASHAHHVAVSLNDRWLYVSDLGSDKIWLHDINNLTGKVSDLIGINVPSGYGPRHILVHPKLPVLYLICELSAHVLTYYINEETGMLTLADDIPTLPKDYKEMPSGAAIRLHPSNKTLYVSNRTYDSISVFSIDDKTGHLHFETCFATEGKEPRDFNIDPTGKWLVAANQYSNTIVSIKLNAKTGFPIGDIGSVLQSGTPVCVLF